MADPKYQFLHMMLRVRDLEKSIAFYTGNFGMKELRRRDSEGGRYTNAFVGYGPEGPNTVLEFTYNWDQEGPYEMGGAYGHIALGVHDIYKVCEQLQKDGVRIPRPPGPVKFGTTHIAFVEDPDGYKIELVDLDTRR
jgi:lactoylglutathione lyase